MTYATGRVYFDADSHVMETSDWIHPYADPGIRDRLPPLLPTAFDRTKAAKAAAKRRDDPELRAKSEEDLMTAKGWQGLGGWDAEERSRALDLLGFHAQLVFTTMGLFPVLVHEDLELHYGAARALNRAMADFCANDPRLLPVAHVPFRDPELAAVATREAIELGCAAVMVPSAAQSDRSPTHPDYDGVWGALADAEVPFAVHVGGGGRLVNPAFRNNGRPAPADFNGGGENIKSKDFMAIHRYPEFFLSMLVLDGLFDRFPTLKGASVEQGCEWIVALLRRLDQAQDSFRKTEPDVANLRHRPSDYVRNHLRFAPFPFEDVGWVTEQVGPDLLMFGTDYPHAEGGRDPLGRFERSFDAAGTSEEDRRKFYSGNFATLLGPRCPIPAA